MRKEHEKSESENSLNIIYFFDNKGTRTLRISSKLCKVIGVLIAAISVWAAASAFLLIDSLEQSSKLAQEKSEALQDLIKYQAKYDGVFAEIYPNHKEKLSKRLSAKRMQQVPVDYIEELSGFVVKTRQVDSPVSIERVKASVHRDKLVITFGVRNQASSRSQGLLWGIAKWNHPSKGSVTTVAPEGVARMVAGKLKFSHDRATSFAIRQYIRKKIRFDFPRNKKFQLARLEIWVMNDNGYSYKFDVVSRSREKIYDSMESKVDS